MVLSGLVRRDADQVKMRLWMAIEDFSVRHKEIMMAGGSVLERYTDAQQYGLRLWNVELCAGVARRQPLPVRPM